jgi:putative SOS response-associated peptidase YedK
MCVTIKNESRSHFPIHASISALSCWIPAKIADPDAFKIFTTTNARAESILEKPIWKGPFTHSRCLIPLDGFYEWLQRPSLPQPPPTEPGEHGLFGDISAPAKRIPKPKAGSKPVNKFEMPDGAPYALAGLFSVWRPRKGSPILRWTPSRSSLQRQTS